MADAAQTLEIVVSRPDEAPLAEAARTSAELRQIRVSNQHLVLNGVFMLPESGAPWRLPLIIGTRPLVCMLQALTLMPRTELLRGADDRRDVLSITLDSHLRVDYPLG